MAIVAPNEIIDLFKRFNLHHKSYIAGKYNETQLRQEFINPFFKVLGWDVDNLAGYAEAYKDVIHEDAIKVGGSTKAPDYSFRIGGVRKFFVEAKKPSVNIGEDVSPAYQLRRYAWSAKLPLSILTNFEEFAVYDCRIKPDRNDKASIARIIYLRDKDYLERWEDIYNIFSKEAVLKGSFDKYADAKKVKKGTTGVDATFLNEINMWRHLLAQNIALRNNKISSLELNFAVSRTIDRIIFLRICEDRGIEPYGQLMELQNGSNIYRRLIHIFHNADDRYNSGLFHFRPEKDRHEPPDDLTLNLLIDDKVLKDIFKSLYYPESPYEFSVLPADVLGQVYEQFLGKVICLTPGHRAKVEEKPEVKKAGGVFYTPTYIVDYIVKNTVGKHLEGKTPGPRGNASKICILDPACGSGSFLIGAYQYLLDWHHDQYVKDDPEKWAKGRNPVLYQVMRGEWRLTTAERKRILLNNIYGVDIDPQAVEVTKLSLLLKVLEGENEESIANQLKLFHERALPDLGQNIKCGNSLIGSEFYENQQLELFDDEEKYRVNVFNWIEEFPRIFKPKSHQHFIGDKIGIGGFDVVIGNPPYIRIQTMKEWAPLEVEYYKDKYISAGKGNYDIYVVFLEKGLELLNNSGSLGFILPHKFFNAQYGEPIRDILSKGNHLTEVVHFGDMQIFAGATTYTCLLFLEKSGVKECRFTKVKELDQWRDTGVGTEGKISNDSIKAGEWNFVVGKGSHLFNKLNQMPIKLGDVADIFVGLQTSDDEVYIMNFMNETSRLYHLESKSLNTVWHFEKDLLFPLVSGTDVRRYESLPERQYILFPYEVDGISATLIDFKFLLSQYPKTAAYLLENKKRLESREKGKMKGNKWYGYIYLKNMNRQSLKKLCIPRLVESLYASYDNDGNHYLDNVDVGGVTLKHIYANQNLIYLLGLLNSKLLRWYFPFISAPFRGGWMSANRQFLSQLPIHIVDFHNDLDNSHHKLIVSLVEQMLSLYTKLSDVKTEHEKTIIKRQIDATDRQIDKLFYDLYRLTEEEIKIVEGSDK